MRRELIVVDDASTDGSLENIQQYIARHPNAPIRLISHDRNRGKGRLYALLSHRPLANTQLFQDADLEYNPREYPNILKPLLEGRADVVYGFRFLVAGERRVLYFWHALANHLLTTMCNMVTDLRHSVQVSGKAFRFEASDSASNPS